MTAYQFYSLLKDDSFSLMYMGEFDDDLTSTLMRIQETSSDEGRGVKKRVSYLIAECFQNIIRHSDVDTEDHVDLMSKMFLMRNKKGTHYLATTNPIENENIEMLRMSLDKLKKLSAEEIKAIYLNALGSNSLSEKGGGGLGLIEMARKTKNPPLYQFERLNDNFSNFFLHLVLKGELSEGPTVGVQETVDLYTELVKDNVILLRKGDFSQESILPLFKLFESNLQLKKEDLVFKKKSLYILIELLQNMNRHALEIDDSKEGIFMIALENGVYTMDTGNFILKENAIILKSHLDSLQGLDNDELAKRYKNKLMDNSIHEDQGAGIGIIEMFRQSDGEIIYNFTDVDERLSFFSLSATL